jgi:hypothetical protein
MQMKPSFVRKAIKSIAEQRSTAIAGIAFCCRIAFADMLQWKEQEEKTGKKKRKSIELKNTGNTD